MIITAKQLKLSELEKSNFEYITKTFYKSSLDSKSDYDEFINGVKKVLNNKSANKEDMVKLSKCVSERIEKLDPNCPSELLQKVSEVIACAYIDNGQLFISSLEGGMNSFTNYIETFIAINTAKNHHEVLLLKEELCAIIVKMRDNAYYRHNPPDQILEQ